jgi:heme exporter protein A
MKIYPKKTLKIQNLAFARHDIYLFQDLNLTLHSSELLQIRGRNGSGKSTFLRILAGLIDPLAGKIEGFLRENIHYIGHQNGIKANLTVHENLQLINALCMHSVSIQSSLRAPLLFAGRGNPESPGSPRPIASRPRDDVLTEYLLHSQNIEKITEKMGIKHLLHQKTRNLSAGLCRKVCLTRLLLDPRPIWILDEPMTALDVTAQEWFMEMLKEHLENQGIILMATHHLLHLKSPIKTIYLGEDAH